MEDRNKDTANKINTTAAETPPMEAATATTTTSAPPIKTNPFLTETYDTTTKTTAKEIATATNEEKTYSSDSTIPSEELESTNYARTAAADDKDNSANLSQNRMNQILKAHSEQTTTTTTACVEVQTASAAAIPAAAAEMNMATTATTCVKNIATSLNVVTVAQSATAADIGAAAAGASEKSDNVSEGTVVASNDTAVSAPTTGDLDTDQPTPTASIRSIGSFVCRICHNAENPERLVSPCLCKGSLTYVHIHCLERWISTSRNTTCELCQFQYNTEQTLRYTCLQSLRMWYSRSMSRRALQEDCQMFSLLTLVAFGIIGTLLVGIQYYFLQGNTWGLGRLWTKGWMVFFLFTTLVVYFVNIYMIVRSQLAPWYRWWRSARDIKLILENRKPFHFRPSRRLQTPPITEATSSTSDASELPMMMPPTLQPNLQQQQQLQQHHQLLQQHHQQEQQSTATAYPPTPSAAAATTTTTLLPKTLTLQLQLNNKAATAAAIAALDAVVYNKYAKNYNNNMKKCHALRSLTAATAAAAGDANLAASEADVANAAIEIPLDPVVYELASAL